MRKIEIYPRVRPTHIDLKEHVFDIQPRKEDYRRVHYKIIKKYESQIKHKSPP